ncbi:MAG TPA: SH3 domain-containing protein [Aggregatilineales bacterium]|nr:SH3 domain-containing protein [Aggregatilineales bacterium]
MAKRGLVWTAACVLLMLSAAQSLVAQEDCAAALQATWTSASDLCIGKPAGYWCNGGPPPSVQPEGPVSNAMAAPGALVEVGVVDLIRTAGISADGRSAGAFWLRSPEPVPMSALLLGDVSMADLSAPGSLPWQSFIVITAPGRSECPTAPPNSLILQSQFGEAANVAINGVSLTLNGTVLVETVENNTIFAGLSGVSVLFAAGVNQPVRTGQQVVVNYAPGNFQFPAQPPADPVLLESRLAEYIPVALLDRPILVPQPGYAATQGQVNLRTGPTTDAGVLAEVPAGQTLSVLGQSPDAAWLHVRLDSGLTGWMRRELLLTELGTITSVYEATPLPPQRYGELGRIGKVVAAAGVNVRSAPDVTFPAVGSLPDGATVTLLARSPYSPWVKVEGGGMVGWLALITVQTQAVIDALPIDFNVPPPPEPTRVPGSFGNAFPDPNRPENR